MTAYHVLAHQTTDRELGADDYDRRHAERLTRRALQTLEQQAIESPSSALRDLSLESFVEEVKDFTRPRSAYSPGGAPTRDNG